MSSYARGDEVKITIKGTVDSDSGDRTHNHCHKVKDAGGFVHHVFLEGAGGINNGCTVDLVKAADRFTVGSAYEDADGEVFLRSASGGWVDHYGTTRRNSFPSRPMVLLETPATLTEPELADLVRTAVRDRGAGLAVAGSSAAIARELVRNGVKVAGK